MNLDKFIIKIIDEWCFERYSPFLEFINSKGDDYFKKTLIEPFWKLASDPMEVFRAMHSGEVKEGPKKKVSSWTSSLKFAQMVSDSRNGVDIFSIHLRQKDVIVMSFPIMDVSKIGYISSKIRDYEIIVCDYKGKYSLRKVS